MFPSKVVYCGKRSVNLGPGLLNRTLTIGVPGVSIGGTQRFAVVTGEVTPPSETQVIAFWLSRLTKV